MLSELDSVKSSANLSITAANFIFPTFPSANLSKYSAVVLNIYLK